MRVEFLGSRSEPGLNGLEHVKGVLITTHSIHCISALKVALEMFFQVSTFFYREQTAACSISW